MFFSSEYASSVYNASSTKFKPSYLLFRSPSEHTINGHHMDLEMQIIHKAENYEDIKDDEEDLKYAGIAILFSVEEFNEIDETKNKTFQDYFRNFEFDNTEDKEVPFIAFGDVMEAVDYLDRWTYKGSLSEPPCEQYVYWNVVRTTYPIELERFDYFKQYIESKKEYLGGYKNNRKI